ncbi:MAG: hypothetical protein KatS3mg090_0605 [Patescibacteria group bacterium]|nr:MAG: hypothetical protein KatS3mg090_0605 [Patescibacteria group bacterium]
MFDTHCHLNFKAFESQVDDIIKESKNYGVYYFMIPGTDYATSKRAVEISEKYKNAFCSVGLHPHHIYEFVQKNIDIDDYDFIGFIKVLVESDSVKAIGEVGFDRHVYTKTKYQNYKVNEVFLSLQKKLFIKQYDMALKLDKSLIIHCREAESDLLAVLGDVWDSKMQGRAVFHCCPCQRRFA